MPDSELHPGASEFARMAARHALVPVYTEVPAGELTPADVYERLNGSYPRRPAFLLDGDSPETGTGRYGYVGFGSSRVVRTGAGEPEGPVDPVKLLRARLNEMDVAPETALPPFVAGAAGYVAYEAARHFEPKLPPLRSDPNGCPEAAFIMPRDLVAFDRDRASVFVIAIADMSARGVEAAFDDARHRVTRTVTRLFDRSLQTEVPAAATANEERSVSSAMTRGAYLDMVRRVRGAVTEGELIQAVVSQRLFRPTTATPLALYRALSDLNPSPYMYLFEFGDFSLVGASPELLVRVRERRAEIHPIAGTRPRGASAGEDAAQEAGLLLSEKERAEHVMLLDLARNDIGRVCRPGTVRVADVMAVERYSHVMHLVSRVAGELRPGADALDAFVAGFPAGTLTGAPKIRAMELIQEVELEGRGTYCGGAGWFGVRGDLDTGTIIRSILLKHGVAHVQAGGGIVYDSIPEAEYQESLEKAKAPLRAIDLAEQAAAAESTRPVPARELL